MRETHSDLLPDSWAEKVLCGWSKSSSVPIDVVTVAEKMGDWRAAWMRCSLRTCR